MMNAEPQRDARATVTRVVKSIAAASACATGATWLVRAMARRGAGGGTVLVVMYHLPTGPAPEPSVLQSLCISAPTLRRQLEDLGREREIVSLDDAWRHLSSARGDRAGARGASDLAVVTFDDGYAGVHEHALPVLAALHAPAVAYVATGYVGSSRRLLHDRLHASLRELSRRGGAAAAGLPAPHAAVLARCTGASNGGTLDNLIASVPHDSLAELASAVEDRVGLHEQDLPASTRMMTWEQLREIQGAGVDVGGHTVHHVALANVSLARARAEIRGCRDDISSRLGVSPRHFAYPNCYYTRRVRSEVAAAGYVTAATGQDATPGDGADPFALRRHAMSEASTLGLAGYSHTMARCHFNEVFGALRLQRAVVYERPDATDAAPALASPSV